MKAFVFPGQGAQFSGMGKDLYENSPLAKSLFEKANEILGFRITDIMFEGTADELKQTKVTQPAVFLHSVISASSPRHWATSLSRIWLPDTHSANFQLLPLPAHSVSRMV